MPADLNPHRIYFDNRLHSGMAITSRDVAASSAVLHDPYDRIDSANVAAIRAAAPDVGVVRVPMVGHEVMRVYAGTANALALVSGIRRFDLAGLAQLGSKGRRGASGRARVVLQGYAKKSPMKALEMFAKYEGTIVPRDALLFLIQLRKCLTDAVDPSIFRIVDDKIAKYQCAT
jgi:hypothetical protein